jgi:hypothetical protein
LYCAPACGSKCKHKDFELANQRAEALAKRLGPGWVTHVHENMGWHYSVRSPCGRINVSEHWRKSGKRDVVTIIGEMLPDGYTVYLNTDGGMGGRWTAQADTPEVAIREVIEMATAERDRIAGMLADLAPLVASTTDSF